jgi:serine/threonine-protein kinase
MRYKGPILTLATGLVVAAVLMVANLNVTRNRDARNAAAQTAPTSAAAPAEPTPTPAPTTEPPAPPATYAGKVSGGRATIAIATKDGQAIAYLCDGRSVEAWLQGSASNGELVLTGGDGASLSGTFDTGLASGLITAEGRSWEFSVPKVEPPSGLYRAAANVRDAQFVGGWIVVKREQVGLGVLGGSVTPVPPVNPASGTVLIDGTAVPVNPVDGTKL